MGICYWMTAVKMFLFDTAGITIRAATNFFSFLIIFDLLIIFSIND